MISAALVFPNQLFVEHPLLRESCVKVLLIEDTLFFGDSVYPLSFHKQKLAYHRATMAAFQDHLHAQGEKTEYIEYADPESGLRHLCTRLSREGIERLIVAELNDFMLNKRLELAVRRTDLDLLVLPSPAFINSSDENTVWRQSKKRWFMADFYQWQRKRLGILVDGQAPVGGRWSLDEDNRKKLPRAAIENLPVLPVIQRDAAITRAIDSVETDFPNNPGSLDRWFYPITHADAQAWLDTFLVERFASFGPYEDAMAAGHNWIHHSVLTPMLNSGLLTPTQIVDQALAVAQRDCIPLNSLEGFIRQIIGWREFMRATYDDLGVTMRTTNHWQHHRPMPEQFYSATTGIDPVDDVIGRVLDTGYCHHIERLMILGGFMFLCEIDPDAIYTWFMEMFVDSYDWVMVPNVYAMSQHADGGLITTKPYFSGSNYVLKMSNYKKGEWSVIWDALFWRWIAKNSAQLAGSPRWAMMVRNAEKMADEKIQAHHSVADTFLASLQP